MSWNHVVIGGRKRCLKHLKPFVLEYVIPANARQEKILCPIDVVFSNHCFTRSIGKRRCFCEIRYALSFRLPDIMKTLDTRHIRPAKRKNHVIVELVDMDGHRHDYAIYFTLKKPRKKQNLELFVQSAYPRTQPDRYRNTNKRIRFKILVNKARHGHQPVETPRARKPTRRDRLTARTFA